MVSRAPGILGSVPVRRAGRPTTRLRRRACCCVRLFAFALTNQTPALLSRHAAHAHHTRTAPQLTARRDCVHAGMGTRGEVTHFAGVLQPNTVTVVCDNHAEIFEVCRVQNPNSRSLLTPARILVIDVDQARINRGRNHWSL